jgi:hypothetical protein
MNYLIGTLLCSLSVAQAMKIGTAPKESLITEIKKQTETLRSELKTLSQTTPEQSSDALFKTSLAMHRLQSRLGRITTLLEWAQKDSSDHTTILRAFIDYQKMNDRLKAKTSTTLTTAALWTQRAKAPLIAPAKVMATAPLTILTEEENEEELATLLTRSHSAPVDYTMTTPATRRSFSAPLRKNYTLLSPRYVSPFAKDPLSEKAEDDLVSGGMLSLFFGSASTWV